MTVFDENLILETINMIKLYNFDIRTVTLSISLRDCISENINTVCDKIQFKLDKYAKNLVKYANDIENDYSIPIVNKRIAVTPISLIGESCSQKDYVKANAVENIMMHPRKRQVAKDTDLDYYTVDNNKVSKQNISIRSKIKKWFRRKNKWPRTTSNS